MFRWKQYWKIILQITCLSIGDVREHLGEALARSFGTFSNAFLVNKRGLFLPEYQCFELLTVIMIIYFLVYIHRHISFFIHIIQSN